LDIKENNNLQSLAALSNLTSIGLEFNLEDNIALKNLSGLDNLSSIGDFFYIINGAFPDLTGLGTLSSIEGSLHLIGNDSLQSLNGLTSLNFIGRDLFLTENNSLKDFTGMEALKNIGAKLWLSDNTELLNLSGLNNLETIGSDFELFGNLRLENILDLESLTQISGDISFRFNFALSACNAHAVCDYIMTGGTPTILNNANGCQSPTEVLTTCFENVDHTSLVGQVTADFNQNCEADSDEEGFQNWIVHVSNQEYSYGVTTDSSGKYWLPVLEGTYNLEVISPSSFWSSCFGDSLIQASATGDTILTDFVITPQGDCPFIDWDFSMPRLRVCSERTFTINYCNYGTLPSEDIIFSVRLDSFLHFQNSPTPYTIDPDGLLLFEVDALDIFDCDQITFTALVDCDSLELNDLQCIDIAAIPNDLCAPDNTHPVEEEISVIVPSCEAQINNVLFNLLPSNDGNPFEESFCGIIVGSFDPNIKTAIPEGIGPNHEIDKNWKLDYTIEFQNTGNDTAFLVVIKDTISENLDLTTLAVHGASHPFTWSLNPDRELVFTFENILLPDSTTNEPASHGFVQFHLQIDESLSSNEMIEVEIGDYFQDILIQGDTTFTISYLSQGNCDSLVTYTVDGLTGIDYNNPLLRKTKVYPNPTSDILLVLNHQNTEKQQWQIVNNLGITLWQKQLTANEALPDISMASFPSGVYWLKVKTDTAIAVWKVVKQ